MSRIKGDVLADCINSILPAAFNTFPNTTFSQNNGVILLSGVASRYIGYFIALTLVILGLFPVIDALLKVIARRGIKIKKRPYQPQEFGEGRCL